MYLMKMARTFKKDYLTLDKWGVNLLKRWLKTYYLELLVIMIIIFGVIGILQTLTSGKDSVFGTLDGWYSGLATAVTVYSCM